MWKKDSPWMVVSCCPIKKEKRTFACKRTRRSRYLPGGSQERKAVITDFRKTQQCRIDIVNEMIKGYSSQPLSSSRTLAVLFLL